METVSVIIPTYNRMEFLNKAVTSVLNQTFKDFELIIIDDGSTDDTKKIMEKFRDSRIKYYYQNNRGPAEARNNGLEKSSGDYIAFLDSDDAWVPEKLEIQLNAMEKNRSYFLSHTDEIWYKGARLIKPRNIHRKRNGDIFKQSLKLCSISMSAVMIKRELTAQIGFFDQNLEICEDYDYWLRATAKFPVLLINKPLTVKQGGHYDQQSAKYFGLDKFRIYSIEKIIQSNTLTEEQLVPAYKELEQKCRIYGRGCLKYGRTDEGEYYLDLPKKFRSFIPC